MDVFNRLITQLNDLFKSMSPGARITAGLLLAAVVVSIGYLFNAQSGGAEAYLLNGQSFTADEMAGMEGAFGKAGLSDYTVDGSRIRITKSRQAAFLGALADSGAMPARFGDYLELATTSNPFESKEQREAKIKVAKQKELALVIRSMSGVESASVQYDSHKQTGFNKSPASTASVGVKMRGQLPLPESQVIMIRSLVASAIAGLQPESVTIADLNGGRTYSAKSGPGGSAFDDAYLSRTREYQKDYESKIRDRLSNIAGVLVSANVELDREMVKNTVKNDVDSKPLALKTKTDETSEVKTSSAGPSGRTGLAAQQANTPASVPTGGAGGTQSEITATKAESELVVGHATTTTQLAGLTPKRVTISIGVPSTYFEKIWAQRNPTPAGQEAKKPDQAALTAIQDEELKTIREAVKPLIPPPTDPTTPVDDTQLINVTAFSAVPLPEPVGPSFVSQAVDWLVQSWSSVAMVGLAVVALLMLRSFVGAIPAPPEMPAVHSTTVSGDDEAAEGEGAAAGEGKDGAKPKTRSLQRKFGTGTSLREELVEMVREDPDAAANILRGWIGSN